MPAASPLPTLRPQNTIIVDASGEGAAIDASHR
jgi:hypothetical protein